MGWYGAHVHMQVDMKIQYRTKSIKIYFQKKNKFAASVQLLLSALPHRGINHRQYMQNLLG
jgi:hypothetical protein